MYWWTEEIAEARKDCIRLYRALKRKIRGNELQGAQDERTRYKVKKRDLRTLIRRSKERAGGGELCKVVENDPWGLPYQIVTGKLMGRAPPKYNFDPDRELKIAAELFLTLLHTD